MKKKKYLVDTCSFVQQFNNPEIGLVFDQLILKGQFVLSAVVVMELYAGTKNQKTKRNLDQLISSLTHADLLVSPLFSEYQKAGVLIKNYSSRKGRLKVSHHFRDLLISLNALRSNATVITENTKDFMLWKREIKRGYKKDLNVLSVKDLLR